MREKRDCCETCGRFNIDFPGIGMVTAEEEGEHEEEEDDAIAVPSAGKTKVAAALAVDACFSAILHFFSNHDNVQRSTTEYTESLVEFSFLSFRKKLVVAM
jgi:hypothetical protein